MNIEKIKEEIKEKSYNENFCTKIIQLDDLFEILDKQDNQDSTLNKGLDELIKKYEEYANNIHSNMCLTNNMTEEFIETYDKDIAKVWQKHECYKQIIQDLKALKGE